MIVVRTLRLAAAVVALAATACGARSQEPPPPLRSLPRALTAAESQVVRRSNHFAFDLLRRTSAARDRNTFVSPLSVSMAIAMTMNGAANATLDSMRSTLGFQGMPLADINAGYRGLIDLLRGLDRTTDMRIANSVWFRKELTADPDFTQAVLTSFDAKAQALDFGLPSAPAAINSWAKDATNGRIPTIIGEIPSDAVMYLINAIYFKARWVEQFNKEATYPSPFAAAFGGRQSVPMMNGTMGFSVMQHPTLEVAELRYGNAAFAMDIVLPAEGGDLHALVDSLTPERWSAWMAELKPRHMRVTLPRFTLEYERTLNDDLVALGMGIAFDPRAADFRNLFSPNARGRFISEVRHKTFVEVNEEGTEAAAVTSMGVTVTSVPPSFVVDRPFLLVIRERLSGTILFVGTILRVPE